MSSSYTKWIIRAKFNKSLVPNGRSKSYPYKDGQYLYNCGDGFGSRREASLFVSESAAKSRLTKVKRMISEGWHFAVENPEIKKLKISMME